MKTIKKERETVLITGGAGFIGSNLAARLLEMGFRVIVVDNFQTGKLENVKNFEDRGEFILVCGDVNNRDEMMAVFMRHKIDYVYHYAACVGVKRTLDNPLLVLSDMTGIKNVVELSAMAKVKRLFYSSSSEVYGESISFPQGETHTPLNSRLPYAVVKNLGEVMIKTYQQEYGLDYTIFRFFNTYGPKQSENFVISKFIFQALKNDKITMYGNGEQTRTFLYIDDNVEATSKAIFEAKSINQTINVGNDKETTIKELAEAVVSVVKPAVKVVSVPPLAEGDMPRRLPDITQMKEILGVEPKVDLRQGIERTVEYFRGKLKT